MNSPLSFSGGLYFFAAFCKSLFVHLAFSFWLCIAYPSTIYGFWLCLWYLQTFLRFHWFARKNIAHVNGINAFVGKQTFWKWKGTCISVIYLNTSGTNITFQYFGLIWFVDICSDTLLCKSRQGSPTTSTF